MIFFFSATTLITLIRSLLHMCLSDGGAQSIATIPLGDYKQLVDARTCADTEPGSECAGNIVAVFAQWGWCQLLMGFVYVVVLWRYRSLIPLMWLFIGVEWAGRAAIGATKPVYADSTPPGARANILFPILAFGMLGWALLGSGNSKVHGAPGEDEKR